jgi:hypothetical protein
MYLKGKLHKFHEAVLIDNSGDTSKNIAVLKKGEIVFKEADCPAWAQKPAIHSRKAG